MTTKTPLKLTGSFNLVYAYKYIIAYGDGLYVFRKDGTQIFSRNDLKYIYKVEVLSSNYMIVDCGSKTEYIILSLVDGKTLHSIKQPRMDYTAPRFSVSKDKHFVYDYAFLLLQCYVIRIDINTMSLCYYKLKEGMRATCDSICDVNGAFCVLQGQISASNDTVSEYSVWCEDPSNHTYYCKSKWDIPFHPSRIMFLENSNSIILANSNDLFSYDVSSKSLSTNIANTQEFPLEHHFFYCRIINNQYLVLTYEHSNLVIDKKNGKIIARYFAHFTEGCIVENEYWICSDNKILRKPFPVIEYDST